MGASILFCYLALLLMCLVVIRTLFQYLPRALGTIDAINKLNDNIDSDCLRSVFEIAVPKDWRLEDGPHLFITEDDQLLCKPMDDQWLVMDLSKFENKSKTERGFF